MFCFSSFIYWFYIIKFIAKNCKHVVPTIFTIIDTGARSYIFTSPGMSRLSKRLSLSHYKIKGGANVHYEALCIEKQLRYLCIAPDHVMLFILSTHNKTELFIIRHHKYICNQSLKRFLFILPIRYFRVKAVFKLEVRLRCNTQIS
jgi:hypothetical protein